MDIVRQLCADGHYFAKCFKLVILAAMRHQSYELAFEFLEKFLKGQEADMIRSNKYGLMVMDSDIFSGLLEAAEKEEQIMYRLIDQVQAMNVYLTEDGVKAVWDWFTRLVIMLET